MVADKEEKIEIRTTVIETQTEHSDSFSFTARTKHLGSSLPPRFLLVKSEARKENSNLKDYLRRAAFADSVSIANMVTPEPSFPRGTAGRPDPRANVCGLLRLVGHFRLFVRLPRARMCTCTRVRCAARLLVWKIQYCFDGCSPSA